MRVVEIVVCALVVGALALGAYERNAVWESPISLWKDCVAKSPEKDRTYVNLTSEMLRMHQIKEALPLLEKAVSMNGVARKEAYSNLGIVYGEMGRYEEAFKCFDKALSINYYDQADNNIGASIYNNIGLYKYRQGDVEGALDSFREALKRVPRFYTARENFRRITEARMKAEMDAGIVFEESEK